MIDAIVLNRIREKLGTVDTTSDIYQTALQVSSAKKVLTSPPKLYRLRSVSEYRQFGCCAEFVSLYNEKVSTAPDNTRINIMGTDFECDKESYATLLTLGLSSIHVCKERAEAAARIFQMIFKELKSEHQINKDILYRITQKELKPETYYEKEYVKAINVCAFSANEAVICWRSMLDTMGYYSEAIEAGSAWITENGLDKKTMLTLLKSNYTRAKEDKEFMKKLYKPACNKWLVGMLYILQDTHPAILNAQPANSNGFM